MKIYPELLGLDAGFFASAEQERVDLKSGSSKGCRSALTALYRLISFPTPFETKLKLALSDAKPGGPGKDCRLDGALTRQCAGAV